ncbi:D-alanyl-D-alanine carboxypeptidase / D-alanyl-D-alanine-endopeptidase (penicillin-binding protein 4) [Mesobacillus persicus]|uniref:D-alanyl-D-alanine carboxypeptidase / D-alanyl-D-alanine-endopeptidase (Penicillin-binding protein 4) n=1 Tax=Mesobacillus persicus TaxID=930146 RepID=A0A1H7VT01_9BACI|nr:D-alanyl-D-alanine carboxypeptidase/D-alanyl-D-alanine-endopeptidase [Mesobacillus persicus]SEM12482.1 D-alanyl-D-alanine carboxypeptidase / D-alanyl-D-alanine-endopeptidase (penicillin-binding protein 4) [Mesobacillus persicus]
MQTNQSLRYLCLVFLLGLLIFLPVPIHEKAESITTTESLRFGTATKIESILKDERLRGAVTGISIRKADTGEVLYSSLADVRLHPASNMKLLTAVAALEQLGPEYQFSTEVLTDGQKRGKTLHGNLYLRGKGDPTLMKSDFERFAKELKAQGINKIHGNLIGDDNWYDDVRLSEDLNWSDEFTYYGAQVSALTLSPNADYDTGTVIVNVSPATKEGKTAVVEITPSTDYVQVLNKMKTVGKDGVKKISIEREHGTNQIVVKGTIPLTSKRSKSWVAVWEPTEYALDVFKRTLVENGIKFSRTSKVKTGKTPESTSLLTSKKSIPLKELLIPFMKLSNNGHGETLTKEMGRVIYGEGTWEKGLQVIRETVMSLGLDEDTIVLRDGSGMSHKNLIPANELTKLLYSVQSKSWFKNFENSLPVSGDPERLIGGTLRSRMTETPVKGNVKAKTGTLTGVSTLSGYAKTKAGEELIFSIMINNYLESSPVKSIEDSIMKAIVGSE